MENISVFFVSFSMDTELKFSVKFTQYSFFDKFGIIILINSSARNDDV